MKCKSQPTPADLKRSKGLHGEEPGCPQLKVEAKTVEESPDQHRRAGPQPQDGDAERAQCGHQLVHHVVMFPTQVIVHVPVDQSASDPLNV